MDVEDDETYFEKEKMMEYLIGVWYCDLDDIIDDFNPLNCGIRMVNLVLTKRGRVN